MGDLIIINYKSLQSNKLCRLLALYGTGIGLATYIIYE
jgi:hypothetical protein